MASNELEVVEHVFTIFCWLGVWRKSVDKLVFLGIMKLTTEKSQRGGATTNGDEKVSTGISE